MINRLRLFLGFVAATCWFVSYLAVSSLPLNWYHNQWFGALSVITLTSATLTTVVLVIIQIVNIVDPKAFEDEK